MVKVTVFFFVLFFFRKQNDIPLAPTVIMDFIISLHNSYVFIYLGKFNLQIAGLKVKVTVAICRKKKICHRSSVFIINGF